MNITCGYCKGKHEDLGQLRDCMIRKSPVIRMLSAPITDAERAAVRKEGKS